MVRSKNTTIGVIRGTCVDVTPFTKTLKAYTQEALHGYKAMIAIRGSLAKGLQRTHTAVGALEEGGTGGDCF